MKTLMTTIALSLAAISAQAGSLTQYTESKCDSPGQMVIFESAQRIHSTNCAVALTIANYIDEGLYSHAASQLVTTVYTAKPSKTQLLFQKHNPNLPGTLAWKKKWNTEYNRGLALTAGYSQ